MAKLQIDLPRYTVPKWRGGRWAFYFQVPAKLRPEGWPATIRITGDDGQPTSDPAVAATKAEKLNRQLDAARSDDGKGHPEGSIPWLLREYQHDEEKYVTLAAKTKRHYDQCADRILQWSARAGHPHVSTLTRPAVLAFLKRMEKTPRMRQAVATFFKILLDHAIDLGLIPQDQNPAEKPRIRKRRRRNRVAGEVATPLTAFHPYTDAEIDAFVAAADRLGFPSMGDAFLIMCEIGQREGDVIAFRKGQQYQGGAFSFRQGKTDRYLIVPATEKLRRRLDARAGSSSVFLVHDQKGRQFKEHWFRHLFRKVATAAGLPKTAKAMHGRHAAVMRLHRLGHNELEIATITGHSPETAKKIIASHYWERDSAVAAKVIARVDRSRRRRGAAVPEEPVGNT